MRVLRGSRVGRSDKVVGILSMGQPKMGGKETLSLFLKGNEDVRLSFLGFVDGDGSGAGRLGELIRERHPALSRIQTDVEPCWRSDLLLQQLRDAPAPADLREKGLADDRHLAAQYQSRLFRARPDVVVFSLEPEVRNVLWRHMERGYLFFPPPGREQTWAAAQQETFLREFSSAGLRSVAEFKQNFIQLIREIKRRLDAHVVVFNCSSFDPEERTYDYHGVDDPLSLRVHRFNLALIEISAEEGISILDVDRLVAEIGGERHVSRALRYSREACEVICGEFVRILQDIGFFENRPLVMQVGQAGR